MPQPNASELPRVAVIGIHGVNTNEPFLTARTMAKMLLKPDPEAPRYPEFREIGEHIVVEPVITYKTDSGGAPREEFSLFDERPPSIRRAHQATGDPIPKNPPWDHRYMYDQISQYEVEGTDACYDTIKIEGIAPGNPCRVDVFELYWADLSRRAYGAFQGFIELYDTLFFLCSLGRKTLDFVRAAHSKSISWLVFGFAQVMAERVLVLAVPIINLCLLAIATVLLPALFGQAQIVLICLSSLDALAVFGVTIFCLRRHIASNGRFWPLLFLAMCSIVVVAVYQARSVPESHTFRVLGCLWACTALGAVVFVCSLHNRLRRGATFSGWLAAIITGLFFGIEVWVTKVPGANTKEAEQLFLLDVVVKTCEWLLTVLNAAWAVFLFFLVLMNIADVIASQIGCRFSRCKSQGRCSRAAWTAEITMILPATFIVILISAFWKILIELLPKVPGARLLDHVNVSKVDVPSWFAPSGIAALQKSLEADPQHPRTIRQAIDMLINMQGSDLIVVCLVLVFVGVLAFWALLPVIMADVDPPTGDPQEAKSVWLGSSLDAGYKTLRVAGEILRWTYLGCAAYVFAHLFNFNPAIEPFTTLVAKLQGKLSPAGINEVGATLIAILGTAIVLILTAGQGPLSFLALGFRAAIAVALDVVAWLRVRPEKQNPKGRICARFVSLLRHVCSEHNAGASYQGIILVAHSQGTVITTDLLRFLHYQFKGPKYDKTLEPLKGDLPVYLMTFGNPLRQLYDLRFPDLYAWTFRPLLEDEEEEGPKAEDLGVHTWINGYRSGDYVGRYLWRKDAIGAWIPNARPPEGPFDKHQDFCLGEGAHVHYFDETAPSVPLWLNQVISQIVNSPRPPG
jgi:hypothetical protein